MTVTDIVRAWRDPVFRSALSDAERAQLPDNPAGMIELDGTVLEAVAGGSGAAGSGSSGSSRSGGSSKSQKSHKSSKSHGSQCCC